MYILWFSVFLFYIAFFTPLNVSAINRLNLIVESGQYLELCPDGKYHKHRPSRETGLINTTCNDWSANSCCSTRVMHNIDSSPLYNFNHSHCKRMSNKCLEYFHRDLCFYECSPNLGPWLVKVKRKISTERPFGVPLCESECIHWWKACKDDETCVTNWQTHFDWLQGENVCPTSTQCIKIETFYKDPKRFCEDVWDGSWKVVPDNAISGCMYFSHENKRVISQNQKVAQIRAKQIISLLNRASRLHVSIIFTVIYCYFLIL